MNEVNEGYEIVESEVYRVESDGRKDRVVLGRMNTKYGPMFVTWESVIYPVSYMQTPDFFWGRYFHAELAARIDYHHRLLEHYEREGTQYV